MPLIFLTGAAKKYDRRSRPGNVTRMSAEHWILITPLLFLATDFIASFISANAKSIKFSRVLENVQAHILLRASNLLALIPLTPLYIIAQQNKIFQLDNSILNIFLVILIYDFIYYWFHRFSHYAAPLWALHIVHHQPEQLEASVALRDSFLSPVVTWVLAVPIIYLGFPAEVVITAFLVHTFYQVPCHNHWFPRIKWLEYLFITPSLHRVHHGKNKPYVDRNFGNMFSFWDRMFGSLQTETEGEVVVGVKKNSSHNIFLANLQQILKPAEISLDETPVKEQVALKTNLLIAVDVINVLFIVLMYYFYYLQPAYLLLAACASVIVFLYTHKHWQA